MLSVLLFSPSPADFQPVVARLPVDLSSALHWQTIAALNEIALNFAPTTTLIVLADSRGQTDLNSYCAALRRLSDRKNFLFVVLIEEIAQRQTVLQAGADDYLLLPLALEDLAACLRRYQRYHRLLDERSLLRQHAIANERLATIGRLAASIVHSISNPLQAMRGALMLALDDAHNPQAVEEYVNLLKQELERVAKMVNRVRQLYRPQTDTLRQFQIIELLRDTFDLARDELMRQKVKLYDELPVDIPAFKGVVSQIHLSFLSIVLTLADVIGALGGGEIIVSAHCNPQSIQIEFATTPAIMPDRETATTEIPDCMFSLTPMTDVLATGGNRIAFYGKDAHTVLQIELPFEQNPLTRTM